MTEERPFYVASETPMPAPDPLAGLSAAEREVVLAMRRVAFGRAGRLHLLILRWDGVRVCVFDTQQI